MVWQKMYVYADRDFYYHCTIMMASNEHPECTLIAKVSGYSPVCAKPCTAVTALLDKLQRCALNGVSAVRLRV